MTTTTTTEASSAFVREDLLDEVHKRVERINKRASKVGVAPISVTFTGTTEDRLERHLDDGTAVYALYHEAAVPGSAPERT